MLHFFKNCNCDITIGYISGLIFSALDIFKGDFGSILLLSISGAALMIAVRSPKLEGKSINLVLKRILANTALKVYLLSLFITLSFAFFGGYLGSLHAINHTYPIIEQNYYNLVSNANASKLTKAWVVAKLFYSSFDDQWGKYEPSPIRMYQIILPPYYYGRLVVVNRYGMCGELSYAIAALVSDILDIPTRTVAMVGGSVKHSVAEIYVNKTWWVFDVSWTTPKRPVPVHQYHTYLVQHGYRRVYLNVKHIYDEETGKDLTADHGFIDSQ